MVFEHKGWAVEVALAQIMVMAILQGVAEIFPVGPAGHAALLESILVWSEPSQLFQLSVRIGALLGIMAYFWQDLWEMATGVTRALKGKRDTGAALAGQIIVATIPTLVFGFLFIRYVEIDPQSLTVMGWAVVAGAVLLFAFDYLSMTVKRIEHATFWDTALIGVMQVAVLIPGVGRTALAMTMARFLGYERAAAARLSLLLSIPVLAVLSVRDALDLGIAQITRVANTDILGGVIGFVGGLITVAILMAWLKRSSFLPFVVYRLAVGGVILALAYGWIPA
jgi:undecaprenyl-diphosphatase